MPEFGYKQTIGWYEDHADDYAERTKQYSTIDKKQLDEFSAFLQAGSRVLDAGCGSGRDTQLFVEKGFDAVGLDISANLISNAQQNFPEVHFVQGDILNLSYPNESFDGVWAHASVVHFDKQEQVERAIKEFYRVLKQDGILHLLVRAKKQKAHEVLVDGLSEGERFYRSFSPKELNQILENQDFSLMRIEQYQESDVEPDKRPEDDIGWILVLARK